MRVNVLGSIKYMIRILFLNSTVLDDIKMHNCFHVSFYDMLVMLHVIQC